MSDSESDSLDFESADEGGAQEDLELSDLDVDEILNEDENDKTLNNKENEVKKKKEELESKKLEENIKKEADLKNVEEKTELSNETDLDKTEKKAEIDEPVEKIAEKPVESQADSKIESKKPAQDESSVEEPKKEAVAGWDEANWDDLDDSSHKSEEIVEKKINQNKYEPQIQREEEKSTSIPQQKKSEEKNFQDLFSRLNKRDLVQAPKQPETIQQQQQPPKSSSGWNWSNFGTTLLSSAAKVLETVETTLGAPDPTELAAKIAKSQSEYQQLDQKGEISDQSEPQQNESLPTDKNNKIKSDWDNEDEWFSLPLNKFASTVKTDFIT
jgi:hypothetical protein